MRYVALVLMGVASVASAQDAAQTPSATAGATTRTGSDAERTSVADLRGGGARRIRSVTLAPGERCPPSTEAEVVVCYNGGNPFRIPPTLRETAPSAANESSSSWPAPSTRRCPGERAGS